MLIEKIIVIISFAFFSILLISFLLGLYNNYINIEINVFSVFNNFLELIAKNNTNNTNTIINSNFKVYIYNL